MQRLRFALFGAAVSSLGASAFNFTFFEQSQPVSCGFGVIEWFGGVPPFSLTVVPVFNYPTNISIPNSAWDATTSYGSYTYQCDYASGRELVAFMSDDTGLATGGASSIKTVQNAQSGEQCTQHLDASSFKFYLNTTTLVQCETVEIYWDPTATDPVNIIGVIPDGQVIQLPGEGKTYIDWKVNLPAGTEVILAAFDGSALGQGGSGQSLIVQDSGDDSCLDDFQPSATVSGSPTKTRAPVVTITTTEMAKSSNKVIGTSAIIGIVVGFFILLQGALYWFCCRKPLAAYRAQRKQRALDDEDDQGRARPLNLVDSRTTHGTRDQDDDFVHSPQDDQSTVSPFWDGAAVEPTTAHYNSDRGGVSSENLISPLSATQHPYPPPRAALRGDSSSSPVTSTSASTPHPTSSTYQDLSRSATPEMPLASIMASATSSRQQSKMGMTAANPDSGFEGDARPMPRGGWRRHQDGGPLPAPRRRPEEEVLELPPLYDELWTPGPSDREEVDRNRR